MVNAEPLPAATTSSAVLLQSHQCPILLKGILWQLATHLAILPRRTVGLATIAGKKLCPYCSCKQCDDGHCKLCFAAFRAEAAKKLREAENHVTKVRAGGATKDDIMDRLNQLMSRVVVKDELDNMERRLVEQTKRSIDEKVDPLPKS